MASESEKVFSQQVRNQAGSRRPMTILCVIVLLPATLVTIDHELGLGGLQSGAFLLGSAFLPVVVSILFERWDS